MSSEEEIHMLPSLVKVYPLTCRPQSGVWCYFRRCQRNYHGEKDMLRHFPGVQTEKRKCGDIFWRRGSNGEREMLRHFLENGVHIGDRELSSGDWGSNWRMGFIIWQIGERGSNAVIRGSFAQEKILGFKKMEKNRENFGVQEKHKKKEMIIQSG